jgi:hypothetical protein
MSHDRGTLGEGGELAFGDLAIMGAIPQLVPGWMRLISTCLRALRITDATSLGDSIASLATSIAPLLARRVELVDGRIAHARLFAGVAGIATGRGRRAARGVDAADEGGLGERPGALAALDPEQEPLDGAGLGCVGLGHDLADQRRPVLGLPARPGEMAHDLPAVAVEERRLGRLEDPGETLSAAFAGIDLDPLGRGREQEFRAVGRGDLGRRGLSDGCEQHACRHRGSEGCLHLSSWTRPRQRHA